MCPIGPDSGLTRSVRLPNLEKEIGRIEFGIFTKLECGLVWSIFSQCEQWNRFRDAYGEFRWYGDPWVAGSRLEIDLVQPVRATQKRVITVVDPPNRVAWINHVLGYTMEQSILFDPTPDGGTRILTWLEFVGPKLEIDSQGVSEAILNFVSEWFENFAAECDRMAALRQTSLR